MSSPLIVIPTFSLAFFASHISPSPFLSVDPFRAAVPFRGQTTYILSVLSPTADRSLERVNRWLPFVTQINHWTSGHIAGAPTPPRHGGACLHFLSRAGFSLDCCVPVGSTAVAPAADNDFFVRNLSASKTKQTIKEPYFLAGLFNPRAPVLVHGGEKKIVMTDDTIYGIA